MSALLIQLLIAYLLGSISGSLVIGKLKQVDIRTQGSGNAGGTNALRTQGFLFALLVVVIDIGKGVVATMMVPDWILVNVAADELYPRLAVASACGIAAIVGHMYPLYFGFRGGKGGATTLGSLFGIAPWLVLVVTLAWCLCLLLTGYVGVSTVLAAISMIPAALYGYSQTVLFFTIAAAVLVTFAHRSNLQRMRNGEEHQVRNRLVPLLGRNRTVRNNQSGE